MDEDSDVDKDLDNSLLDLHHGLDSSTDENRIDDANADQDADDEGSAQSMKLPAAHVNMLEEMVQEMRQGLQAAVEELAKLQDREDGEKSRKFQEQQQRQLDDLTENVHEMKSQFSSMMKCMETIQRENKKLKDDYVALQKDMKEYKVNGAFHPPDIPLEWTDDKSVENPFEKDNEEEESTYRNSETKANDDVTAVACKSLSLTQALGENCLHLNLSISSEDGEEPETRRLSSYVPSTEQQKEQNNRRHSLPASTTPRTRSDHIANAAQRRKAVKELIDSECDYCSQLWTLIETYFASLQTAVFLTPGQVEFLFPSYLEKLYEQHCAICSSLQDKLVHWSYLTVVSDVLSCITDSHNPYSLLSMYHEYSENLLDAVSCLRSAMTHSAELKAFLKTIEQSSCQSDDLMTLIKAPAQHLPKYLLQLQQICKYTPSTHPDYLLLRTSLSRLRLFVEQINVGMNNAMQTSSQDHPAGSSNDSSQVLSARDSGNQSNDDDLLSARTLFKSEQCLVSDEWHEEPFNTLHPQTTPPYFYGRHSRGGLPRHSGSNFSTHSHPDLTLINTSPVPNSVPYSLPPTGRGHGWRNGMDGNAMRQINKTRQQMKRMQIQPDQFASLDPNHHLSRSRPSSAIDFVSHYNSYPQHHYPGTEYPRPRSAMGPIDSHHRPNIISRKHIRRSQPPLSNSGYWADIDTQHSKHPHHKMPFSAHDLLPSRPSPLLPHNSQENDEEDDTRASDSFSFLTNSSHRHSSGHSSHNGRDLDLDFHPMPSDSNSYPPKMSKHFSEDDVAARLAQELLSDDGEGEEDGGTHDGVGDVVIDFGQQNVSNSKANIGDSEKKILESNGHSTNELQTRRDETRNELPTRLTKEENNKVAKNPNPISPMQQDVRTTGKELDAETVNHRQRILKDSPPKPSETNKLQENNRQFLLSLTHSPRSKKGPTDLIPSDTNSRQETLQTSKSQAPVPPPRSEGTDKKLIESFSTDKVLLSQNSRPKVVRRSAPNLPSHIPNGFHHYQDHEPSQMSTPKSVANDPQKPDHDSSVNSATSKSISSRPRSSGVPFEMSSEGKEVGGNAGDMVDPKSLMTRSFDLAEILKSEDSKDKVQDKRKKVKNAGADGLPKAGDDPVSARKKMHLKSSIKNLFSKKRGKVILADVEKEVILEMASSVMTTSTSSLSTACTPSSVVLTSCHTGSQMSESLVFANDKSLSATAIKGAHDLQEKQSIPSAFEMKLKKEKGNSTSSPVKFLRQLNGIQRTENLSKPLHMLTLVPDQSAQSPCAYQEKIFKERLDVPTNPQLEQKPLIHPKFLLSTKPAKDEGNRINSSNIFTTQPSTTNIVKSSSSSSSSKTNVNPVSQPSLLTQRHPQEGSFNGLEDKKTSRYGELPMKCSKTKRKGYAHMRKHCLNYESQEAQMKEKEDEKKRCCDKTKVKTLKHKEDCPNCHNKSPNNLKEQNPGKSFHIQAYKAYKNKTKESSNADKRESEASHQGEHLSQDQNKITSNDILHQSSMDFLKPCEDAIIFYETSNNPKMTSSYPMVLEDRKLRRKAYSPKDTNKGPMIHGSTHQVIPSLSNPTHNSPNINGCKSLIRSMEENISSFSTRASTDSDYCRLRKASHTVSNMTPTNDLSHPTSRPLSFDATNLSKAYPYSLNVPAPKYINVTNVTSNHNQSLKSGHPGTTPGANLLRMSKDEFFRYKNNCSFLKEPEVKTELNLEGLKQKTSKDNGSRDCAFFTDNNLINTQIHLADSEHLDNCLRATVEESNDKENELKDSYVCKEDKDYVDYTYRLCYVDGKKFEANLRHCSAVQTTDNEPEKKLEYDDKSVQNHSNDKCPEKRTNDINLASKGKKSHQFSGDRCIEIDKSIIKDTETIVKSSTEKTFTSGISVSVTQAPQKDLAVSLRQPKEKCMTPNEPCSFFSQSKLEASSKESSCHSSHIQNRHAYCLSYSEIACPPNTFRNRYNARNITSETFSARMSQPIFSVLPFEQYSVECKVPVKNGSSSCAKSHDNTNVSVPTAAKSHDACRRALKQRVKSSESSRHSSSSIQSANEIHILQLNDLSDAQRISSTESENQSDFTKGSPSSNKNMDTLQVRYIPKQYSPTRRKVQTTAHAQINKGSNNGISVQTSPSLANGSLINTPNGNNQNISLPPYPHYPNACQIAPINYEQNGLSASALSGPDLLQVSVMQPGNSRKYEPPRSAQVHSPPKKQSFFARFAHSPLSIFHKDAKSNGTK